MVKFVYFLTGKHFEKNDLYSMLLSTEALIVLHLAVRFEPLFMSITITAPMAKVYKKLL